MRYANFIAFFKISDGASNFNRTMYKACGKVKFFDGVCNPEFDLREVADNFIRWRRENFWTTLRRGIISNILAC